MGAETALVIMVALLWGPTAIWLIYRASRGSGERHFARDDPGFASPATWRPAREDLGPLAVDDSSITFENFGASGALVSWDQSLDPGRAPVRPSPREGFRSVRR